MVVVLELGDVAVDLGRVGADSSEHKELLEVFVVAEWRQLDDDVLEHFDELNGKIGLHEGSDGGGDIIRIGALGNSSGRDLERTNEHRSQSTRNWEAETNLVNELTAVVVARNQDLRPKLHPPPLDEITSLLLEHRVVVGQGNELVITEAFGVGDVGDRRVALLAVLSDNKRLVQLVAVRKVYVSKEDFKGGQETGAYVVLSEERLRVVVAIDIDLGQRVEQSGVLLSTRNLALDPRKEQLETVPLLDLLDELLDGEDPHNAGKKVLDRSLVTANIQKTTNDLKSPRGVNALDVHLDELVRPFW